MSDCRLVLDNINDYSSLEGALITGSDVVDISSAQMTQETDGWKVFIKTVSPAQQNPRLEVSVALYLDVDGRMDNNATAGPRLGADTVYGIVSKDGGWKITREGMKKDENAFLTVPTKAMHEVLNDGYVLNIPYNELPKTTLAYWKVGVAEKDAGRLTVDYVPDVGLSCVPSLAAKSNVSQLVTKAKGFWVNGGSDIVMVGVFVIAALLVIFFRWNKKRKQPHDFQA